LSLSESGGYYYAIAHMTDTELLRQYAEEGSQEAFAAVVRLRIGLVYASALRRTGGDAHRAQDITQSVFTELARHSASLCRHRALVGWLFTAVRYTAATMARSESRRRVREQEAYTMHENLIPLVPEVAGERLRPMLDEALDRLSELDRRALLLRFFEGCSMAELGRHLGYSEAAAKKRVERALAKLKTRLAKRGLLSSAAALGAALSQEAVAAVVPTEFAATVSGNALIAASVTASGVGMISFMTVSKLSSIIGVASILGLLSIGIGLYELRAARADGDALAQLRRKHLADEQRFRQLESALRPSPANLGEAVANATPAPAIARPRGEEEAAAQHREARATAEAFFRRYPEARPMFTEFLTNNMQNRFAPFFRAAGLSQAQVDEFVARTTQMHVDTLEIDPAGAWKFGQGKLPPDEERSILGASAVAQLQSARQVLPTQDWVSGMGAAIANGATPLSADQVTELTQVVAANSPNFAAGKTVYPDSVDWAQAAQQVQSLMTDAQWQQAQSYLSVQVATQRLQALMKGAR
jgi:RNA polymerase sigma factor (sigma-70 family)